MARADITSGKPPDVLLVDAYYYKYALNINLI
jgi:hypothetical protein